MERGSRPGSGLGLTGLDPEAVSIARDSDSLIFSPKKDYVQASGLVLRSWESFLVSTTGLRFLLAVKSGCGST